MPYVLFVQLDRFYVHALIKRESSLANALLVVIKDKVVLDACVHSTQLGIVRGTPISRAKVLLSGRGAIVEWKSEDFAAASEDWLNVCTEYSNCIEPVRQDAAFIDLQAHAEPKSIAQLLIDALSQKVGCTLRYGSAASKWQAEIAAQVDGSRFTPLSHVELHSIGIEHVSAISIESRERLCYLGYTTIGQVCTIPKRILKQQFPTEYELIYRVGRCERMDSVSPLYPPGSIIEHRRFENSIENEDGLQHVLDELATSLGSRLRRVQKQASEIEVSLELESGKIVRHGKRLNRSVYSTTGIKITLAQIVGMPQEPVASIHVALNRLSHFSSTQSSLYASQISEQPAKVTALDNVLHRVQSKFGQDSLLSGNTIETPRRKKVLKEWEDAIGWR